MKAATQPTSNESEYVWPATRWPELTNGWGTFNNDGIPGERGVEDPIVRQPLPEGQELDATVTVKGRDYYIFKPAAPKYKLQVSAGSEIWWFNGESPSGYAMQTDASHPQIPPAGVKITHSPSGGSLHIGSDIAGKGVLVKTLKWQFYQDHGRHE